MHKSKEGHFQATIPIGGLKKFLVKVALKKMHGSKLGFKVPIGKDKSGYMHVAELDPATADITIRLVHGKSCKGCLGEKKAS